MEEEVCEVPDAWLRILQANGHAGNVPFHLHHVIQDEMSQHHQTILAHPCMAVNPLEARHAIPEALA